MRAALDSMEDPILHLAVHLTLVGALREGEVAGLTPEDIDFDAANGMGTFTVSRSMQRVQKDTLAQVDKGCTRRRRTHHLHDGSFGIAERCRPGDEGKTPPGTAHLMQKRALIAMQYSALHHRTWKTPIVHPWLRKQKSHEIFRFHGIFWCDGRDSNPRPTDS